ncbi:cysteine protease [Rhizobium ruizarguesonis]|uniref:C1 family peptidase n=1 Tax=Rhizobium ruizarguesonis TaxID=2081791 RepID=UPI0010322299|nr:C1 family peptidase [Rhizobium ruizarguesonis]TAZ64753.1 cysteine protease [Rhizobium ruizarguesonis]TAZ81734.1 cysteine protease [Rhizobium ruizarguesonis]
MDNLYFQVGTGWIPDQDDGRDYSFRHADVLEAAGPEFEGIQDRTAPETADLTQWFPPVFSQGQSNSCTAQAAAGIVSYYQNRAYGKYTLASRLFIYKSTRNLLFQAGDKGAYIRTTIGSLVTFGSPPEIYWPFDLRMIDAEPTPFCYAFGDEFRTLKYFSYEKDSNSTSETLQKIKGALAAGVPSIFGFYLFPSMAAATASGEIPFPEDGEMPQGGHAVVAVGYDDNKIIAHPSSKRETKGAFKIRNSWGSNWGEQGYGWLPYEFVLQQLASDWWSIISMSWFDAGEFGPEGQDSNKSRIKRKPQK